MATAEEELRAGLEAQALAIVLMNACGLNIDENAGPHVVLEGKISMAVVGGALMLCAGRVLSGASDESVNIWIRCMLGERRKTKAEILSEH